MKVKVSISMRHIYPHQALIKLSVPNFHSSYIPIGFRMEQKVDFLFQYLRTLVAIGSVAAGRSFTVYLWRPPRHPLIAQNQLHYPYLTGMWQGGWGLRAQRPSIRKKKFESRKFDANESQDWRCLTWIKEGLNKFQGEHISTHIHAETGLMALV